MISLERHVSKHKENWLGGRVSNRSLLASKAGRPAA